MNWREYVESRLLEMRPASLCALDDPAHQLARTVLPTLPVVMHTPQPASPCALALGVNVLNGLSTQDAQHLINQTRLYVAPRILLVAPPGCALDDTAFRALGFTQCATDIAEKIPVYYYDLDTYKTVPDWLNARHWAHPERWEP